MEAQGEKLLQSLVDHEASLLGRVEEARREAQEIIRRAEAEAQTIRQQAQQQADKLAADGAKTTERESDSARNNILGTARTVAGDIEARAGANFQRAVNLVMERVLP